MPDNYSFPNPKSSNSIQNPPIPAAKNRIGEELIYWALVRWSVWNSFERVWVQTHGPLPTPADGPLIVYLNHPSWWDGYMALLVARHVLNRRYSNYLMMEEPQLRSYRFFTWCGCFSVDRHDPRSAARSVAYISHILRERRGRALYIFPQGVLTPNDQRPLVLYPGVAHIVKRVGEAVLLPAVLRYEFRGEQRPEAFISVGPAHSASAATDARKLTNDVAGRLTSHADALREAVVNEQLDGFRPLLHGRPGVNRVFDSVFGRLMKRLG